MPDTNTAQTTIFKGDNLLGIAKQAIFKHTVFREGRPPGTWGLDMRANCRPAFGHVLHYLDNFFICLERLKSKELN